MTLNIDVTIPKVLQWAEDRNLIKGATPKDQYAKLIEEISEFTIGIDEDNIEEIKDGLGDTLVVATILAAQTGTTINESVQAFDTLVSQAHATKTDAWYARPTYTQDVDGLIHNVVNFIGELSNGLSKKNPHKVQFGIGGLVRTIAIISTRFDTELADNYAESYEVIKYRTGRMVDGAFIKQEDLIAMGIA